MRDTVVKENWSNAPFFSEGIYEENKAVVFTNQ